MRYFLMSVAFMLTLICQARVTDLPVKQVNGRDCYCYTVRNGESLYGVVHALGITREQLIRYNPSAADVVRAGMILYFPVSDFGDNPVAASDRIAQDAAGGRTHVVRKGETLYGIAKKYGVSVDEIVALNPSADGVVEAGHALKIPVHDTPAKSEADTSEFVPDTTGDTVIRPIDPDALPRELKPVDADISMVQAPGHRHTVAIMLPFMLGEEQPSRGAMQTLDFYKGFLLAVDSLGHRAPEVDVLVYDTENNVGHVVEILENESDLMSADIIVAPDNSEQLAAISAYGQRNGIYVLNNVSARDSSYLHNPYMLHSPVPTPRMYSVAIDDLVNTLDGRIPVILNNESGRNDKQAFVDELVAALATRGILPALVTYSGTLAVNTLNEQLPEPAEGTHYIFLPVSASLNEFNKYSGALQKYKTELNGVGADMSLYGYPEWVTFRNDALETLHDLTATIYSRSFNDGGSYASRKVSDSFVKRFGKDMSEGVPSQGLLGFDTANFILNALLNGGFDASNLGRADWNGVQSTYHLRPVGDGGGAVNDAVYIIRYLPGNIVEVKVL